MNDKTKNIVAWVLAGLLAFAFLGSAAGKLTGNMTDQLAQFGVPEWAVYVIGVVELLAAIGVLLKPSRVYAAGVAIVIMLGAIGTHFMASDFAGAVAPLVLGLLAGGVIFLRKEELPF